MSKQMLTILITLTLITSLHSTETLNKAYSSFALRLGYEFGGPITFTLKTGGGIYQYIRNEPHVEEGLPFKTFGSFSIGYRWRFGKNYPNYTFLDLQTGKVLGGAGVGLAFFKEKWGAFQLVPRVSIFGGLFIWGTYDYVFFDTINPDIGLQLILVSP